MKHYLALLRLPGIPRVLGSQLLSRLPTGMLTIAALIHAQTLTGSYATAGFVVAFLSVGEAIMLPILSRMSGVVGARRLLVIAAIANAAALTLFGLAGDAPVLLCVLALFIGASVPPLQPVVRALYRGWPARGRSQRSSRSTRSCRR